MPLAITVVDAFSDRPFAGNPAAVCVLAEPVATSWMQHLARELNLSETAYLTPESNGGHGLRWFTPTVEVDLCGHATLAAAHVLWESGRLGRATPARFFTRSGPLTAVAAPDGWITLDFPAAPLLDGAGQPLGPIAEALAVAESAVVAARMSRFDLLVEVDSAAVVRTLRPDLAGLARIPARGVIVTARAEPDALPSADFVSRFFGPRVGVPEDPVTGSAHCALGPYWAGKLGRGNLVGYQASERGGVVRVAVSGDRVFLGGQAATVWQGHLAAGAGPPEESASSGSNRGE